MHTLRRGLLAAALLLATASLGQAGEYVETPYAEEQRVMFQIFLDDPAKLGSALFWLRSFMNPLTDAPYGYAPEWMDIKVVLHGTELVALVEQNYDRYETAVERMKYYAQLGVEFRVCAIAAEDYGYRDEDFYDFVKIVPSAITELAHWQQQGYALIRPVVTERHISIEEMR
jgi:intracellular sulfur oxidation DsrE/DsrF family protein